MPFISHLLAAALVGVASALSIRDTSPVTTQLHPNFNPTKCLAVLQNVSHGPGKPLYIRDCSATGQGTQITFSKGLTKLVVDSWCIGAADATEPWATYKNKVGNGYRVHLAVCGSAPNAAGDGVSWTYTNDHQLQLVGTNLCLDNTEGRFETPQLWSCVPPKDNNQNQFWYTVAMC